MLLTGLLSVPNSLCNPMLGNALLWMENGAYAFHRPRPGRGPVSVTCHQTNYTQDPSCGKYVSSVAMNDLER